MTINMNDKENMRMETTRVVDLNLLAQFSIPSKNSKAVLNIWIEKIVILTIKGIKNMMTTISITKPLI